MSKRLLNEEAIRRFQKLANITSGKLNENMHGAAYMEDAPAYNMGSAYKEDEPEMDDMEAPEKDDMEASEMDDPMPEEESFTTEDLKAGFEAMLQTMGVKGYSVETGEAPEMEGMEDMEGMEAEADDEVEAGDDDEASDEELMESMARRITKRVVRRLDEAKRKDRKAEVIAERVMRRLQKLK